MKTSPSRLVSGYIYGTPTLIASNYKLYMFRPRQLLVSTLIILLFSCNNTDKQKEKVNSPILTKKVVASIAESSEINLDTTRVLEKKPVAFKIKKTKKAAKVEVQTLLENDLKTIEQGFQDFVINTNFDTTIFCKEGTVIKIKHSSFLREPNLTEVKETVIFQVKEFYKISDILSARLSTYSNGNILETGGMLFIQVSSNGNLCKLY